MSVLGFATNITQKDFFFLRANVSSITADSVVAKNISSLTGQIGSLTTTDLSANFLVAGTISTNSLKVNSVDGAGRIESFEFSSVYTYADIGTVSTLFTQHIILDSATLDVVNGTELLLNGVPIATTANLSSIQDWAVYPAASTINMIGNNITNAGNINSQNIYNALAIQTDTLSALTSITAPSGTIINTRATNLSTTNLVASNAAIPTLSGVPGVNNSTIVVNTFTNLAGNAAAPTLQLKYTNMLTASNFGNITTDGSGGLILTDWYNNSQDNTIIDVRRNATNTGYNSVANFSTLNTGGVSTGSLTVAGQPYAASSNWAQYPANANVSLNGFDINSGNNATLTINALSNLQELSQGYSNVVDKGIDIINPANIFLNAKNGQRGKITLQADAGTAGIFGQIDITANGGTTGGIGTGGLINITANTPLGLSNATSAVKINAAGINSYAGAIPPIGSLAGYNFIYGMGGVNICAGLPSVIPNTPLTTYLYGSAGVVSGSDFYTPNIYPYWNGLTTPPDMLIAGRYIIPNVAQVYVNLSNVKNLYMDSIGYIHNVKTMDMIDGTITQANTITGSNSISGYATISGTNLNTSFINSIPIADYLGGGGSSTITSTFTIASISSLTVSSINGLPYSAPTPLTNSFSTLFTSTLAFSTATSVGSNTAFNYPIFIDYDSAGATTAASGVAIAVSGHNFGSGAAINRIEMGARANGENYIMSVWPGQNLEELVIDATDVNFRDSDGFSTIVNQNPYGVATNGIIKAPEVSTSAFFVSSINGVAYPQDPVFGEFLTTTTITVSGANTPTLISLDTLTVGNGVSLVAGVMRVLSDGLYVVSVNIQYDKSGGGTDIADFWIQVDGVDVPNTASRISIVGSSGLCLAVCSFKVSLVAGNGVGVIFASPDATMAATYFPAWTTPTDPYDRPAVPALIANIQKIR